MKKADILLVYPPHRKITFVSSIPHLSAYAKKKGFIVDALDAPTLGLDIHDIVDYVGFSNPRSIGISVPFTSLGESALKLVQRLNKFYPEIPLIVGGVHATLCPHEFTDYAFVCLGDGEGVLNYFLNRVVFGALGEPRILERAFPIEDIEPPEWGIVASEKYQLVLPTGERGFPIQTSRGCPFFCIFCSSRLLFNGKIQHKTINQVDKEIKQGMLRFGSNYIVFRCENFTIDKNWFIELCHYLKVNEIKWWAQTNANLMNEEYAKIAKDSGCVGFSIGIETADPIIMKKIKKGITLDQGRRAFKILKDAGLHSAVNFIIGLPWDNMESVQKMIDYADEVDPDYFGLQIAIPFPETEFRKIALEQGAELSENWSSYNTTRKDVYIPPGLKGHDLSKLRDKIEWSWFMRKPSRFFIILSDKRNLKAKFRFIRRMFKIWNNSKGQRLND
jgi:radical SAM superfamily enzyme YgiQ (UPF0313 family)